MLWGKIKFLYKMLNQIYLFLLFSFPCILRFSYFFSFFIFQCFSSICFFLFFNVFRTSPSNQQPVILSNCYYEIINFIVYTYTNISYLYIRINYKFIRIYKYEINLRLLDSSAKWYKKIDFSLCIVALYVKAFWSVS